MPDGQVILAWFFGLVLLAIVVRLLLLPLRLLWSLVSNGLLGGLLLFGLNWVGGFWGFHVPVNPWTALLVGLLGLPGLALAILLQHWP